MRVAVIGSGIAGLGAAHALRRAHEFRLRTAADLTLGVFPVEEPERFGPVEVAPDGSILRILDKPPHREVATVWGVCAWTAAFSAGSRVDAAACPSAISPIAAA